MRMEMGTGTRDGWGQGEGWGQGMGIGMEMGTRTGMGTERGTRTGTERGTRDRDGHPTPHPLAPAPNPAILTQNAPLSEAVSAPRSSPGLAALISTLTLIREVNWNQVVGPGVAADVGVPGCSCGVFWVIFCVAYCGGFLGVLWVLE